MKQTVAIIFGGCSSEYEVSLVSASAVLRAVDAQRYEVLAIGITRSGQWLYTPAAADDIAADRWHQDPACLPVLLSPSREDHGLWLMGAGEPVRRRVDVVFPVLHGKYGEDGTLQGLLELAGIPFVGCGCLCSALCMDKEVAHHLAMQAGILCPEFITLYRPKAGADSAALEGLAEQVKQRLGHLPYPWFVKPASEGSSFGVSRVENPDQLAPALANAFRYGEKIVVEQGISGFEVGCAILGGGGSEDTPFIGAVDAIALQQGFFDFHEKYNLETAKILLPAPVEPSVAEAIKAVALRLYRLLGCTGYARVDLFLSENGDIIFNEINTIPGMTEHSRFPGMLRQAGVDFPEMVQTLIEQAVSR